VFAATSLTAPFEAAEPTFHEAFPSLELAFQFSGSQQLRTQLEEGAQADVFASADGEQMQAAVDGALADPGQVRSLISNQLVVVLAEGNPAGIREIADLGRPGLKLALADRSVPVGHYTSEFLNAYAAGNGLGLDFAERVWSNAVSLEQNVGGVGTKVATGEVDAGVVYRTDAIYGVAAGLPYLEVPAEWSPPILYVIAPLIQAPNPSGAGEFVKWILSGDGQALLAEFGFLPPTDE
jgi:molybdate transport system substrate-binding protein